MAEPDDLYSAAPDAVDPAACAFYHVMDIPGHGLVGDAWDLRAGVGEYLGGYPFKGARVLEIGPASGFLTFHLDREGAEVVSVELGPDADWDVVPQHVMDLDQIIRDRRELMERLRNGWWFAREKFGASARVHHGSGYDLPDALGRFDVSVMACILLHTRDPLRIVEECARLTDDALVIVERSFPDLNGTPTTRLVPSSTNEIWDTWWDFSPEVLAEFVRLLGFTEVEVSHHEQLYVGGPGEEGDLLPLFTIVARRS